MPELVIDHANGKEPQVIIRDVLGNEYNEEGRGATFHLYGQGRCGT